MTWKTTLKNETKLIFKGVLAELSPKLWLAGTLMQVGPRFFASTIKELRGWTQRQLYIFTERLKMTPELRRWVYKTYGQYCLRCRKEWGILVFADQIDHVLALYNGGKTEKDNLQPLCGGCNRWKGTRTIDYRKGGR